MGSVKCKSMLDKNNPLSMRKQCNLLSVSRGSLYFKPKGESRENLQLMRL